VDDQQAVSFDVRYPESSSRLLALLAIFFWFKLLLIIPHGIILYALWIAVFVTNYIAQWVILFTGKYPRGLFDFGVGVQRWSLRVTAWLNGWTDQYPPFGMK
jgi:hypothetical protein